MYPPVTQVETRHRWFIEEIRRDAARYRRQPPTARAERHSHAVRRLEPRTAAVDV